MLPSNFQESLICIEQACHMAGLSFNYVDKHKILAEVIYPNQEKLFFVHNKNPFNNFTSARICRDKTLQAELYSKYNILHPHTKSYFNPTLSSYYDQYKSQNTVQDVCQDIIANFSFPFFFKKNISSLSRDVHFIENKDQLINYLNQYFNNDANIILIQAPVKGQEYRVVSWRGKPLLAYKKGNKFSRNPYHAEKVNPEKFKSVISQIYKSLDINFFGADVIESEDGLYVLETNPNPACFYYNKYHGREDFTQVYLRCLQEYQS